MTVKKVKVPWCKEPVFIPGLPLREYRKELGFQVFCADWLRKQFIVTGDARFDFWHHSANGLGVEMDGWLAKMSGQSKGFPDFVRIPGMAIELKVGRNGTSEEQERWLNHFRSLGWVSEVVRSFDGFKKLVLNSPTFPHL